MFLIFQNDLAEKRKAETELHREETAPYAIVDRKLLHKPPPRIIKVNGKCIQSQQMRLRLKRRHRTCSLWDSNSCIRENWCRPQPHSNNPQEPHPIPQQPGKTTHAATNAATPAAINCASTSLDKATNKFFRQFDPTGFWTTTTGAPTIVITCWFDPHV